jgi:DNA-binding transcriptional LysR family regulator
VRVDQLKTALTIAKCKSYTRASEELFLAQPSVTAQINSLEKELGFKLFERSWVNNRQLVVTEQGATYLYYARQALWMLEEGRLEAAESGKVKG